MAVWPQLDVWQLRRASAKPPSELKLQDMTDDEAQELLETELTKRIGVEDHVSVTVQKFKDWKPICSADEFMSDPSTLKVMLVIRFWRYINGQKFMSQHNVVPLMVSDSLALPALLEYFVSGWVHLRDDAIRIGPPVTA